MATDPHVAYINGLRITLDEIPTDVLRTIARNALALDLSLQRSRAAVLRAIRDHRTGYLLESAAQRRHDAAVERRGGRAVIHLGGAR